MKHKARYVAKSFNQVLVSDYLETFAPTAKLSSIRSFLALAIHVGCEVFQFDVSSAYLNADLEDVFVQQPPGFEFPNKDSKLVCELLKGLYGLKQAGKCWNKTLDNFFFDFGVTRSQISQIDSCYSMTDSNSFRLFLCVWVDDIMYFSTSSDSAQSFKTAFSNKFKIDDKGQ